MHIVIEGPELTRVDFYNISGIFEGKLSYFTEDIFLKTEVMYPVNVAIYNVCLMIIITYSTRRNCRGGLIFVLFAGEVDLRKLMRTKIKNYGPSP